MPFTPLLLKVWVWRSCLSVLWELSADAEPRAQLLACGVRICISQDPRWFLPTVQSEKCWAVIRVTLDYWSAVCMMCLLSCLHLWLVMWHLIFLSQDTTDYVAYVAKDPVNRRGKRCVTFVISHSWAARLNNGYQMVLMISALFIQTKCHIVLLAIIEVCRQWSMAAHLAGLGDAGYLRALNTHLYPDG